MKQIKKDILHSLTASYFQKQKYYPDKKTMLPLDIKDVTRCSLEQAWIWAATYCNVWSWYSTNRAAGNTNLSFKEYLAKMLSTKIIDPITQKEVFCITKEGYFNIHKEFISPVIFGYEFEPEFYEAPGVDINDLLNNPLAYLDPDYFYQMKMRGTTGGTHFVGCYVDIKSKKEDDGQISTTGVLMGDDTSYRGIPFEFKKYINSQNFLWLMKIPNVRR